MSIQYSKTKTVFFPNDAIIAWRAGTDRKRTHWLRLHEGLLVAAVSPVVLSQDDVVNAATRMGLRKGDLYFTKIDPPGSL